VNERRLPRAMDAIRLQSVHRTGKGVRASTREGVPTAVLLGVIHTGQQSLEGTWHIGLQPEGALRPLKAMGNSAGGMPVRRNPMLRHALWVGAIPTNSLSICLERFEYQCTGACQSVLAVA